MAEFTGERVVPGQVDTDLWNEHVARYAFAARLCSGKRVLDAGCGSGYGAAELARTASAVVGVDLSQEAVEYAQLHYPLPNLSLLRADCIALPFADGSFDVVVAFEVIEHLQEWLVFLSELRRLIAPGGRAILSTPNRCYYLDSRGSTGPNPYHTHEFTFAEFHEELSKVFPSVSIYLQNHVEGFVFQPVKTFSAADARVESGGGDPEDSHFFVAICSDTPVSRTPTFVYLPRAANILREREQHIEKLHNEVARLSEEQRSLLGLFRRQTDELEERNRWAQKLDSELEAAGGRIRELQDELQALARGYEAKVAEIEEENRRKTDWAHHLDSELARCVDLLHEAESTVKERTAWALGLQSEIDSLRAHLGLIRASRWVRLGRALRVGPEMNDG